MHICAHILRSGLPEKSTTKHVGYCARPHGRFRSTGHSYQGQPSPWERLWSWVHCWGLTACTSAELPSVHFFPRPPSSLTQLGAHISTWKNQNAPTWPGLQALLSPSRIQQWLHPTKDGWGRTKYIIWGSEVNYKFSIKPIWCTIWMVQPYASRQCAFWWQGIFGNSVHFNGFLCSCLAEE